MKTIQRKCFLHNTSSKPFFRENLNVLKEFGVDMDEPDLFSSEKKDTSSDDLLGASDDEEDDLEIPAFLRRQKN